MKITIELDDRTIIGIKSYLNELDGGEDTKISKAQISQYIQGIVDTTLNSPAENVSKHIEAWQKAVFYKLIPLK